MSRLHSEDSMTSTMNLMKFNGNKDAIIELYKNIVEKVKPLIPQDADNPVLQE